MNKTYFEFRPCFGPNSIQKTGESALSYGYVEDTGEVFVGGCTNSRVVKRVGVVLRVCTLAIPEDECLYGLMPDQPYAVYKERKSRKSRR